MLSSCWLYRRYETVRIYFCVSHRLVNWGFHASFIHSARVWVGNGSPFTQPYSALNKINKTYLSTFSARDNFSFYERKKISLKKKKQKPQFNITDISKNLLQAFEIREEQQSLYCFESGRGKISLPRIYLYTAVLLCHCLDLPFLLLLGRLVKSCRKGLNKAGSVFTPLTMEAHVK